MLDPRLRTAVRGQVTQVETLNDLALGHFDAVTTVQQAFRDCIIGLGVAEAADGEIVAVDGLVWRIPADGRPVVAAPGLGLPFAVTAAGGTSLSAPLPPGSTFEDITVTVDALRGPVSGGSTVVAVRIDGSFTDVVLRSEPRQQPPYQMLSHVLEHEVRFPFTAWTGTLAGFRFADDRDGTAIPGLHLHAISSDRASGGHCHQATVASARLTAWVDDVRFVAH